MNKIEKILNEHCGAIRFSFHNDDGDVRDEFDIICAIKEFGELCFNAGREGKYLDKHGMSPGSTFYRKYTYYEDFLKSLEDETN